MNPIDPKNQANQNNQKNETDSSPEMHQLSYLDKSDPGDKVVPLKPKKSGNPGNPTNQRNQTTQTTQTTRRNAIRRTSLPKQPDRKVTIRKHATVKKKQKEPLSAKTIRKKYNSFWQNHWEVVATIIFAIILGLFVLPRFLQ